MPVIQARPVISGMIAGCPATSSPSTSRPVKRVPITDSLTKASLERELAAGVELGHPRARAGAARRAVQPARVDRGRGDGVGAVAAGLVEDDVAAAADARVGGMLRAVGGVDRLHHRQAGLDQLAGARRVDDQARVGGRRERVEVAAERHVVGDRRRARGPRPSGRGACRNDGTLRIVTERARPFSTAHPRLDEARGDVEPDHGLGLGDLDHPGLDQHGRDADRAVPAHRQAAATPR